MSCVDGELGTLVHFTEGYLCLRCTEERKGRGLRRTGMPDCVWGGCFAVLNRVFMIGLVEVILV